MQRKKGHKKHYTHYKILEKKKLIHPTLYEKLVSYYTQPVGGHSGCQNVTNVHEFFALFPKSFNTIIIASFSCRLLISLVYLLAS